MDKAKTEHGNVINTSMAGLIKSSLDGVTVNTLLTGDKLPYGLELTLDWPNELPVEKVDFAIVSYNDGHSFMCLFSYGSFGPRLIYSENSNEELVKDLAKTTSIKIEERSVNDSRTYQVKLKYCL